MLVILEEKAYLFDLNKVGNVYKKPELKTKFGTSPNPNGIGLLFSPTLKKDVVILPNGSKVIIYDSSKDDTIEHDVGEEVHVLAGNAFGGIFAYANKDGQKIQVHKIDDGSLINMYNRGKEPVEITSISIDMLCSRMAVASKKETIHVFSLPKGLVEIKPLEEEGKDSIYSQISEDTQPTIPKEMLESRHGSTDGFLSRFIGIGSTGERSYLKLSVDYPDKVCSIIGQNLVIIRSDGKMHSIDIQNEGKFSESSDEVETSQMFTLPKIDESTASEQ